MRHKVFVVKRGSYWWARIVSIKEMRVFAEGVSRFKCIAVYRAKFLMKMKQRAGL